MNAGALLTLKCHCTCAAWFRGRPPGRDIVRSSSRSLCTAGSGRGNDWCRLSGPGQGGAFSHSPRNSRR